MTFEEWVASLGVDYFAGADPEFVALEAWNAAMAEAAKQQTER